ncbi:unnamed protein product [Schistosoma curassoni]|uniref:Uncharacterized protein n=1 Tax=Schistosoma curassoni TaxID=6186 RepID=A0A183JFL6_9TREM|nr:unnamed protein product [Schistosoma curassoni]
MHFVSGGSMKGNFFISGKPMTIICKTSVSKGTRRISGVLNALFHL